MEPTSAISLPQYGQCKGQPLFFCFATHDITFFHGRASALAVISARFKSRGFPFFVGFGLGGKVLSQTQK
jgi:hypothetical protein